MAYTLIGTKITNRNEVLKNMYNNINVFTENRRDIYQEDKKI